MGNLNSGQLTLLAFGVLALFGVLAYLSLRKHIRGIAAPTSAELEAQEAEARAATAADAATSAASPTPTPSPSPSPSRKNGRGPRSPKASSRP